MDEVTTVVTEETAVAVKEEPKPSVFQPPVAAQNYEPTIWNNKEMMNAVYQAANVLSKTDMIPASYRGKPGNCFVAIDMAQRMGVSPLLVMGTSFRAMLDGMVRDASL